MLQINFPTFCLNFKGGIKEVPNTCIISVCKDNIENKIIFFDYNTCEIITTYASLFHSETVICTSILNEFPNIGNILSLLIESEKLYLINKYTGIGCLKKLFVKNRKDFVGFEALTESIYSDLYIQQLLKEENV